MANIFTGLYKEIEADMNGPGGRVYYGWWNILACYPVIMFCFSAPLLMLQFIYVDIETELGFSRGDILTAATFKFGTAAIAAFFAGFLVDYLCGSSLFFKTNILAKTSARKESSSRTFYTCYGGII